MSTQAPNGQVRQVLGNILRTYGLFLMTVVLLATFAFVNEKFFTLSNLKNVLEQNAALAVVSVGVTFAIISRNIDLSPGSSIALASVMIALVFQATGNIALALTCGMISAIFVGAFNGLLITVFDINPVIVTLAAMIWARGLALAFTEADSIVIRSPFIGFMNNASILGISPPILLVVLAYVVGWFLLTRTRLGRYTYAIGGDETATKQAGVRTGLYTMLIFMMSGVWVGVATVITIGRLAAAVPNAAFGLELDAIVAVIIGGNRLSGGEGSMGKTIFGVLFIAILNNGLSTLGVKDAYFFLYKGVAILLALFFEVMSRQVAQTGRVETSAGPPNHPGGLRRAIP